MIYNFKLITEYIPTFEKLKSPNLNVLKLTSFCNSFPPKYFNKNYYEEQIDLLLHENHTTFAELKRTLSGCVEDF